MAAVGKSGERIDEDGALSNNSPLSASSDLPKYELFRRPLVRCRIKGGCISQQAAAKKQHLSLVQVDQLRQPCGDAAGLGKCNVAGQMYRQPLDLIEKVLRFRLSTTSQMLTV